MIWREKYFSLKIMQKMRQRDKFQTSFCFSKKLYVGIKEVVCTLVPIYFDSTRLGNTIKTLKLKYLKTLICWSRDMRNFDFLEKGPGLFSPPHFMYEKMFAIAMLYSLNWPNFIVWLSLLLEILGNMCITIICFLSFLIKLFYCMTKKSQHPREKTSFLEEIKSIFHHFKKGFSCPKSFQT